VSELRNRPGPLLGLALLAAMLAHPAIATAFRDRFGPSDQRPVPVERLLALAMDHAAVALLGVIPALVLGIGLGVLVTRRGFAVLRPFADSLSALAQATPPIVVVALAFPMLGFGILPTVLALATYGIMPIYRATAAAFETLPINILEAARALGMSRRQILIEVELPLAAPLLADAIRTVLLLGIATAAVGALAGAQTLGTPIITGLQTQNEVTVLQGAAATAALACAADACGVLLLQWWRPAQPEHDAGASLAGQATSTT
jgi:osmoprotectant transport system permease protein